MAYINVDEVYILDNTGLQVDMATDIPFVDAGFTDAQKAQARANIAAGGSNDNLLDNWYFVGGGSQLGDGIFPINQRGQSSYSGGGTSIDRWKTLDGSDTIVLTADGVKYKSPNGNGIFQYFPYFPCGNDTCTFSVKIGGTIYSITLPEGQNEARRYRTGFEYLVNRSNKTVGVISANTEVLLQEFKLEKGSISTLANDVRPDFGEQLEKCKRYWQRVRQPQGYTASVGFGMVGAASNILRTTIPLSSPLRNAASITATATNTGQMFVWGNGSYYSVTGVTGRTVLNGNAIVDITVNGTLENYKTYNLILNNADAYIDLSVPL